MSPLGIPDMKGVVIDVRVRLLAAQVDPVVAVALHVPDGGRGAVDQDAEDPGACGIGGQVLFADLMLPLAGAAVDDRDPVFLGPAADAAAEAACQAHQVGVVEVVVRVEQIAPPGAKASRGLRDGEVGVDREPIDAVIDPIELGGVMLAERIGTEQGKHRSGPAPGLGRGTGFAPGGGRIIRGLLRHGLTTAIVARTTAPQGPLFPGEVPEKA